MAATAKPDVFEQRRDPRYPAALEARVRGLALRTTNISVSGLQLSCPDVLFSLIRPELDSGFFDVEIMLPGDEMACVTARVVYCSDAGDEFLIGAHFEKFDTGGCRAALEGFIAACAARG